MNLLRKLRIRTRLFAGFLCVLVLVGASSVAGIWRLGELGGIVNDLATRNAMLLAHAKEWEKNTAVNLVRTHTTFVLDDREIINDIKREMTATSAKITQVQKEIDALASSEADKRLLASVAQLRSRYLSQREELQKRKAAGQSVRDDLAKILEPLAQAYLGAVQEFAALQEKQLETAKQVADDSVRSARILMVTMMALGIIAALVAAFLISHSIVRPIRQARERAEEIATGDLTSPIAQEGSDEVAEMVSALATMQAGLRRIAGDVRRSADTVNTASREIAQGNSDLSTRTEQQASALEETSASMQQMTATVGQNAENAKKANELALQASGVATRGGEVVRQAVGTMNGITESSKRMADIIGVIDGIAFQTNILALNAAVEAARAGEQGRGFAVVASEVRSLAQRSGAAAKEIKDLITDSVAKVDAGSRQVNEAGRTMEEIVGSVKKVSTLIAEITAASQEQAQGIEQVSDTMTELEKVTQQNAAMVEEASAAAGSLEEQSQALTGAVAAFRLEGHANG